MQQIHVKEEKLDTVSSHCMTHDDVYNGYNHKTLLQNGSYAETDGISRPNPAKIEKDPCEARTIEELFAISRPRSLITLPKSFQIIHNRRQLFARAKQTISTSYSRADDKMDAQLMTYADMEDFTEIEAPPSRKRRNTSGKRGSKGNGTSPYTTVPLPPCKVCGGVATGYHFGVITCEACKAFFRRALIHKHNYKCLKDDNCPITDKKLGNCSACRLKKCFDLGMSKGGVRRGRYSIAIRTQAILEAKARETNDMSETVAKKPCLDNTVVELPVEEPLPLDVFDGLLDISELTATDYMLTDESEAMKFIDQHPLPVKHEHEAIVPTVYVEMQSPESIHSPTESSIYITPEPIKTEVKTEVVKPASPKFVENRQLEFLIDAVMSCQDAVYPNLKKQYSENRHLEHFKIYEEQSMKEELFGDLFGTESSISTAEFQQIFAETGLDLDDRLCCFNKKGKSMEETIAQYVNFAKLVPGFKSLNPKDVAKLLKAAHFEFWMLGNFMLFDKELEVSSSWDGAHKSTKKEMMKFFDAEIIDATFEFTDRLKDLNLTLEEIALVRLIVLTYTDRCPLNDVTKIQTLQEKFVECLNYYLNKNHHNPGQRLIQLFDTLLAMRDVTHINIAANKKFLSEWDFLMHDYPLWKEMLSYDGES